MKKTLSLLSCVMVLGACSKVPSAAYFNRGDPENLIDISSEVINVDISSAQGVYELERIIKEERPTRAELYCMEEEALCKRALHALDQRDISTTLAHSSSSEAGANAVLMYERTIARDCENRYLDNSSNNANLSHPTFGCSITGNMVQMVTDKSQFTNPPLMDYPDAEKAGQAYGQYLKPAAESADGGIAANSLLESVSTGE